MTAYPSYMQMEPVGQCNLKCRMCAIQFRKDGPPHGPPAFMAYDTYVRVLDGCHSLERLHLQGLGEPMMHPRFFDMAAYAARKGIRVSANTNLTLLSQAKAEACVSSGLDTLHISADGATKETYEFIRVRSRYDRLMTNIERLLEARARRKSKLPHLGLVAVVMRRNLHELPDLVRLARRWSMEEIFVQHLCHDFGESSLPEHYKPMREFVQSQTLLEEDINRINDYFNQARDAANDAGIPLRLPHPRARPYPPGTPGSKRCDWPWRGAYVSYDGYAMPCCMVGTPDRIHFGSMAAQGFEPVWNNAAYNEFRRTLDSNDPPEICKSCSLYKGSF